MTDGYLANVANVSAAECVAVDRAGLKDSQ